MTSDHPVCACGCGRRVSYDARLRGFRTYANGHNPRVAERKPRVAFTCAHCRATSRMTAAKARDRVFCSAACRDAHHRACTGPDSRSYSSVPVPCLVCEKVFPARPAERRAGRLYCTPECGREGQRRKLTGAKRKRAPGKSWWSRRDAALARDGHRCRVCGFALALHVHHIKPRREGGTHAMDNLITLCPNDHAMAHAGLLPPAELLAALAQPLRFDPLSEKARVPAPQAAA